MVWYYTCSYVCVEGCVILCGRIGHFTVSAGALKCVVLLECRYFNMKIIILYMAINLYITMNSVSYGCTFLLSSSFTSDYK